MKSLWKKILIGLVLIVGIVLYLALDRINVSPYFETAYFKNTITRLGTTLDDLKIEKGQLKSGFSRVNITPKLEEDKDLPSLGVFNNIPLAGYGDRASSAMGIHDSVFVRAVALQVEGKPLIFVGADLLIIPTALADSVYAVLSRTTEITRDQIFFGATHTHSSYGSCAAGFVGEKFGGVFQPEIISYLSNQIVKSILLSIDDLKVSTIGVSHFKAEDFVKNRMIGKTGKLNDVFTFTSIKQKKGKHAIMGVFAAHATTLGASNLEFSGDYPGYWERKLEAEVADVAIFFAGTMGSHSYKSKGDRFEKSKFIGEALADSVILYLDDLYRKDTVSFTHFTSIIDLPEMQIRVSDEVHLDEYIGNKLIPGIHHPSIQGMKMDNFLWMTLPCELSGEYAIDLKNSLELNGYQSAFTSFNGSYLGYVVPAKYYHYDNYESYLMGWYGPSMGDYIMELLYTSCGSMTGERL